VNYKVQGTEGDIVKLALYRINQLLSQKKYERCSNLLQVHDEFIFEAPEDFDFPTTEICSIMEQCGLEFGVVCKAKPEIIKTNWAEGKELQLAI
jgi:DNA polymerase I-like protein with 3'-5' exonuclease and polymerase domains